jgi:DNA processing protein
MRAPDDERLARLALMTLAEPNDANVWGLVRLEGPAAALERITSSRADERYRPRLDLLDPVAAMERADRLAARFVVPGDLEWPSQLADLDLRPGEGQPRAVPPLGLWVRGPHHLRTSILRSAAVVGSRAATGYGSRVAADLGAGLSDRGWATVSGAAYGIDSAAHRGALAAGGVTVAVLACGVDVAYPRGHQGLLDRIGAEGLVVAELPFGAHPTRGRFLDRNRLIAALTPGTVVVEAAHRSGAVNTTTWARRMRRPVLGVPGPVTSPLSAGVHREIRERGATLVGSAGEVVAELGQMGDALSEAAVQAEAAGAAAAAARRAHDGLSPDDLRVLDSLDLGVGVTDRTAATRSGVGVADARAALRRLAGRGLVEVSDGRWRARASPAPRQDSAPVHRGGP